MRTRELIRVEPISELLRRHKYFAGVPYSQLPQTEREWRDSIDYTEWSDVEIALSLGLQQLAKKGQGGAA